LPPGLIGLGFGVAAAAGVLALSHTSVSATPGTCPVTGATITWTGAAGDGNWSTAGNWSPATTPGSTDFACIPADTDGPASISVPTTSLTQFATYRPVTLTGTLTVSQGVDIEADSTWGSATLSAATLHIGSGSTLTVSGSARFGNSMTMTNDGTVRLVDGGTLYNLAGSTVAINNGTIDFADTAGDGVYLGGGRLVNTSTGLVSKSRERDL
jgi:hypothetical protein